MFLALFPSISCQGQIDLNQLDRQEKADAENSVVATGIGRFIPPTDQVAAAAVLVRTNANRSFSPKKISGYVREDMTHCLKMSLIV